MKLFLLAVCFVALATARPGKGGEDSGEENKKGRNPVEGLVKLCIGLAEEALADGNKRSWEDVFGQLAPVCEAILEELEDKERPKPSGAPDVEKRRRGGDDDVDSDDRKGGKGGMKKGGRDGEGKDRKEGEDRVRPSGPPPSGPPPSGAPRKDSWLDERTMGEEENRDPVEALLKICEGLAKMAEKQEAEGKSQRSIEALLEAMKAVCEAAFDQAEQDGDN